MQQEKDRFLSQALVARSPVDCAGDFKSLPGWLRNDVFFNVHTIYANRDALLDVQHNKSKVRAERFACEAVARLGARARL